MIEHCAGGRTRTSIHLADHRRYKTFKVIHAWLSMKECKQHRSTPPNAPRPALGDDVRFTGQTWKLCWKSRLGALASAPSFIGHEIETPHHSTVQVRIALSRTVCVKPELCNRPPTVA